MAFVVFNTETTILLDTRRHATMRAAKSALTRAVNAGKVAREDMSIAEASLFFNVIEQTRIVKNMMSGKEVEEKVNTPSYMSVGSESYWSM